MLRLEGSLRDSISCCFNGDAPVQVFWYPLTAPEDRRGELFALLSAKERNRAERFKFVEHCDRFVAARAGLRLLLAAALGIAADEVVLEADAFGKPFMPACVLQFNLTHAGGMAAVAIARERRVGIDIEPLRMVPNAIELAQRFFASGEAARLQALKDSPQLSRAFLECWTRKEAFVKAIGKGLSYPLASFEVSFYPDTQASLSSVRNDVTAWSMQALDLACAPCEEVTSYCGAMVVEKTPHEPEPAYVLHSCGWQR